MPHDLSRLAAFEPPPDWRRVRTLDAHTGGEPLRILVEGVPKLAGATILEKRRAMRAKHDDLRRALMWEPRGHADMYGCVLTEPVTPDGDVGVLFMHNEGYSTMCGHAVIAVAEIGVRTGLFPATPPLTTVRLDTPAGRVVAEVRGTPEAIEDVRFRNVPSFLADLECSVDVPGIGRVSYDLGFGGAFYAYVDALDVGLELEPARFHDIVDLGRVIKQAVEGSRKIEHPSGDSDLEFLYGTIFHAPGTGGLHSRNVCVFADGEVDRSPTGTGVSGRAAVLYARGLLELGEELVIESLVGSRFTVRVVEETRVGELGAVIPEVGGRAHLLGRSDFWLDPSDPLGAGFFLR